MTNLRFACRKLRPHHGLRYRWLFMTSATIAIRAPASPNAPPIKLKRYCTRQRSGGDGGSGGGTPRSAAIRTCFAYRTCCLWLTSTYQATLGATISRTIPRRAAASQSRLPNSICSNLIATAVDFDHLTGWFTDEALGDFSTERSSEPNRDSGMGCPLSSIWFALWKLQPTND